jgi:DNA polymerase-3 subunit beta
VCRTVADIKEEGVAIVPGKMLVELSKKLPKKNVYFEKKEGSLELRSETAVYNFPIIKEEEYPELPERPKAEIIVNAEEFRHSISQVLTAVAKEEIAPHLSSIKITTEGNKIIFVSTDRYRAAYKTFNALKIKSDKKRSTLIIGKYLAEVQKSLEDSTTISIGFKEKEDKILMVGFETETKKMTVQTLEANYPPIDRLLDNEYTKEAIVKKEEIIEAIERISILEFLSVVNLSFSQNELTISAGDGKFFKGSETIECIMDSEDIVFKFNPQYILDGVKQIDEPLIRFKMTAEKKPVEIIGLESINGKENMQFRYMTVPIYS